MPIQRLKRLSSLRSPMKVTATGYLREYLRATLLDFTRPILLIYPQSYSGCPKCHSEITIYRAEIMEWSDPTLPPDLRQVGDHRFPIDVYWKPDPDGPVPTGVTLGTRPKSGGYEMVVRKVNLPDSPF